MFHKLTVLKNIAKFSEKHLCWSLLLNEVAGLRPVTLLKKDFHTVIFFVSFVKFLRIPFSMEHLRWLLLVIVLSLGSLVTESSLGSWVFGSSLVSPQSSFSSMPCIIVVVNMKPISLSKHFIKNKIYCSDKIN